MNLIVIAPELLLQPVVVGFRIVLMLLVVLHLVRVYGSAVKHLVLQHQNLLVNRFVDAHHLMDVVLGDKIA